MGTSKANLFEIETHLSIYNNTFCFRNKVIEVKIALRLIKNKTSKYNTEKKYIKWELTSETNN